MIRILVFGMTENPGGVESFLINYYRHMDKNKIQFDFLCNSHNPVAYENELIELGGRTFHITARSKNRQEYKIQLENLFKEHSSEWKAIWVNVCSLANIDYLKIAKKYGIKKRIIHSHNSRNMDCQLRFILHKLNRRCIAKYATDFWSCSEDASHWFYNPEIMNKAVIIHNAIDTERMMYDEVKRQSIRHKYGLENKFVIGNVGRFHFQKNQAFAIEIFSHYYKNNPNSVLVLVGQGEDKEKLKRLVKFKGLENVVIFTGVQKDIQGWLSCFDLFLFPSKFEGVSVVALEAQVNGLPVLASKGVIPEEVKMNDNFVFLSLESSIEKWSKLISEMQSTERIVFNKVKSNFIKKGYEIKTEVIKVQDLLLS